MGIEIKGLSRSFSYLTALNNLHLNVNKGEFLTLQGPNGAGKTTLLKILATLMKPTSGEVKIFGFDLVKDSNEIRKKISFLSHEKFLYDNLTAFENIKFFSTLYGIKNNESSSIELLKKVGIIDKKDELTRNLSSGMKQRLSIARAFVNDPEIILFDEPFTGLDYNGIEILRSMLFDLKSRGKTVVMATHNRSVGLEVANRLVLLDRGEIKLDKKCSDISIESLNEFYPSVNV